MTLLAHISDPHFGTEDPRVVETLLRGIQDLVFLTGAFALATEKNALLSVLLNYSSLEHKVRI